MRIVNPQTGASITGESGDNIGRGGRKLCYFKDESAWYERPEKIEAALADNTRGPDRYFRRSTASETSFTVAAKVARNGRVALSPKAGLTSL